MAETARTASVDGTPLASDRTHGDAVLVTWAVRLRSLWDDFKAPLLVFLGFRVFLTVAVYLVSPFLPPSSTGIPWKALPGLPLLDVWARWDSAWYAGIVEGGYKYSTSKPSNIVFFPVYPLAIKAVDLMVRNMWISGILISNLSFMGALVALFKLSKLKLGSVVARRTVFYVAAFPAAFFYYTMYSESIYLLTVVLAFYCWERRNHWLGGIFGALAALTRPMGILLFLAGAALHLVDWGGRTRPRISWNSLSLLLIPLALGGFLGYSLLAFGEPLAFLKAREVGWNESVSLLPVSHRELAIFIVNGSILREEGAMLRLLDAITAAAFLALTVAVFRRLGPAYGLYSLGSLMMPLVVTIEGLTRYAAVVFPVFMVLASWRQRKALVVPLVILSALLMGLLASMFARWHFVG